MAKSSDSNIQDLSGTLKPLSEPNPYPFELGPQPDDGVISSLDSRRELLDLTRDLLARTHGQPGNYRQPVVRPLAAKPSAQPTGPRPVLAVHSPGGTIETTHPVDSARYLVGRYRVSFMIGAATGSKK